MNPELLDFKPKSYLCPHCGIWHEWRSRHELGYYDAIFSKASLECPKMAEFLDIGDYQFYFDDGYFYYSIRMLCRQTSFNLNGKIKIESITESSDKPIVTFKASFKPYNKVGIKECLNCINKNVCNLVTLRNESYNSTIEITLGFEFEESDYEKIKKQQQEESIRIAEQFGISEHTTRSKELVGEMEDARQLKENKEETTMKKMNIWKQLYETSPKENVEMVKQFVERYRSTLQWAIPVVTIYAAYMVLNSKNSSLNVKNIDKKCKKLGFKLEELSNKKALNDLIMFGKTVAGAYAVSQFTSFIFKEKDESIGELDMEQIEEGMEELDRQKKKYGFMRPMAEKWLPVAVSVLIVYVMTEKPVWFEKVSTQIGKVTGSFSVYFEMIKYFIMDKLNINVNNEEEAQKAKKVMLLAAIVAIGAVLYGKKVLIKKKEDNDENESTNSRKINEFISQLVSILKQMAPTFVTGVTTFLVMKKVLPEDVIDAEFYEEEEDDDDDSENADEADEVTKADGKNEEAKEGEAVGLSKSSEK